ncbi:putative duf833 domain-containing protein [Phaeoacremonium minimum UCRPA7]|uniref:Putative duf833 domain-containing protein n=1 Tax=Phaeoacremonium minimum (strain UCR-PA7) TaxID=1286976 RepID=R8BVE5_PHAM7|nr:putative duf833 domain-containing protein [Phaeoacremonium minimum UCRPA7]EOO03323.1 putative duf833 domain-containing protein [Phaeoacremonium minimum UCRPA7]
MCIVLLTTAHPSYALIVIDNRDEFILRPTSRPHWWTALASRQPSRTSTPQPAANAKANGNGLAPNEEEVQHILSSRDLQRSERGTWLGVTRSGHFAVLTNYRETNTHDASHPIHGTRSRGGMVTAWLGSSSKESVKDFVSGMLADGGCKHVGGFSLICGKLRKQTSGNGKGEKNLEPLAILSNRSDTADQVPWIAKERGEVHGLSNTSFDDPATWPKVEAGKRMLTEVIEEAKTKEFTEDQLRDKLFSILDQDTLPVSPDTSFEEYIAVLKQSIFIPAIGDEDHRLAMEKATAQGIPQPQWQDAMQEVRGEERPDEQTAGFGTGMYGTQRQTILLVDWDGNVTYTERALWDSNGNPVERGKGDMTFKFEIAGWNDS